MRALRATVLLLAAAAASTASPAFAETSGTAPAASAKARVIEAAPSRALTPGWVTVHHGDVTFARRASWHVTLDDGTDMDLPRIGKSVMLSPPSASDVYGPASIYVQEVRWRSAPLRHVLDAFGFPDPEVTRTPTGYLIRDAGNKISLYLVVGRGRVMLVQGSTAARYAATLAAVAHSVRFHGTAA